MSDQPRKKKATPKPTPAPSNGSADTISSQTIIPNVPIPGTDQYTTTSTPNGITPGQTASPTPSPTSSAPANPAPTTKPTVVGTTTLADGSVVEIFSDGTTATVPGTAGSATTQNTQNATSSVDAWANSVGLGSLSTWINEQIQTLAGQGMAAGDIASTIADTINTAPGFDQLLPGYNQRIKNGYTNSGDTGSGIAGYMAYRQQIQAMAETAGIVPGTITMQDIGNAWAGDVSANEMSQRITTEYTNAVHMLPQIQNELKNYGYTQGLDAGQLASMFINPDVTVNTLQQQLNAAQAGGEGVLTGFGEIGQSKAYALQAFLTNGGQNALGAAQAGNFFSGSLGGGLNSISQMAQSGFENAQLGTAQNGPGIVDQSTLLAAGEGNAAALQNVQRAAQTRAAPSNGGGGFAAGQAGVVGAGFGTS